MSFVIVSDSGFTLFSNSRNVHGGGGVVSNVYESSVFSDITNPEQFMESIGMQVTISKRKCLLLCVYRPPKDNFKSFYSAMNDILPLIHEKKIHDIYIL